MRGFRLSNDATSPNTHLLIEPGRCLASDDTTSITLAAGIVKRIDAPWAQGNNNGGFDAGVAPAGFYWAHAIYNPSLDATDAIFSASINAPILPAGWTARRLLHGLAYNLAEPDETGIFKFVNVGEWIHYKRRKLAFSSAIGPTMQLASTAAPIGAKLEVDLDVVAANSAAVTSYIVLRDPDLGAFTVTPGGGSISHASGATLFLPVRTFTNNLGKIYVGADTATESMNLFTAGFRLDRSVYR